MASGIRAIVEFEGPDICPIVKMSEDSGVRIDSVSRNISAGVGPVATTDFTVENGDSAELLTETHAVTDMTPVFSDGSVDQYRMTHGAGLGCPCECLGRLGCPISRYVADTGVLRIEFCATDFEELQDLVGALQSRFSMNLKRLVRTPGGDGSEDYMRVDKAVFTARQLEVLRTAYEMGYFDQPRGANATEVADCLEIHPSTVTEHLRIAQRKFLDQFL